MLKKPLVGKKGRRKVGETTGRTEEWGESERCARAWLFSINSHVRLNTRRCVYHTRSLYWATYRSVPWCLHVDQQQRSLMLARGSLAINTCYIIVPMVDQNLSSSNFLVWYVLLTSKYSVLAIGPPYGYVIPTHICYQYSYILLQSNTLID